MVKARSNKPVKEESFVEKIGHSVGNAIGAVKEKWNELVHPEDQPVKTKRKTQVKQAPVAAKKTVSAKKQAATKTPAKKQMAVTAKKTSKPTPVKKEVTSRKKS